MLHHQHQQQQEQEQDNLDDDDDKNHEVDRGFSISFTSIKSETLLNPLTPPNQALSLCVCVILHHHHHHHHHLAPTVLLRSQYC